MEQSSRDKIISFADQYLGEYKIKQKSGGDEIIPRLCPLCHGGSNQKDTDTFALSIDKGVFVCKRGSCGRHGRFEELAKEITGESVQIARAFTGKSKKKDYCLPETELKPVTDEIYKYFESRGISRETVDDFRIAADKDGMIVFRFFENNVDVYEKFRRPWKPANDEEKKRKEWQRSNTKPILYHMDDVVFTRPLIITEGQCDAMALYEAGLTNVVSVPSGCDNIEWVDLCWDWLERFSTIILFGDNDEPGRRMINTLIKKLGEDRVRIVENYPVVQGSNPVTYCKDANEILLRYGEFELIDMVENATEIPTKGLINLGTVKPIDPTTVPRIKTMIPELDYCIGGLVEGGVTIMTGKSGDGKSTLSGLLLLNAIQQGYNVCAYSGELSKERFQQWINLQAAGSEWIGLKYDPVKGVNIPYVPNEVQERICKWYDNRLFLFDNNEIFDSHQAESIVDVFTTALRRYDAKLFLVDNMMTALSDEDEEIRAQAKFINALKKFANRYKVHVLIVAHPRKTKLDEKLRKDDVGGSSYIVNLADSTFVMERPDIRIIKNRDGGVNKLIECCYCGDSRRIYQADKGDLNKFSWDKSGLKHPSPRADSMQEYGIQLSENGNSPF